MHLNNASVLAYDLSYQAAKLMPL